MIAASPLLRSLAVYAVCVPLAIVLGYMMAMPYDLTTFTTLTLVAFVLVSPLLLRHYHLWLIATWNMSVVLFFLPGRPQAWLFMAYAGVGVALLQYILNRRLAFQSVPSVSRPLLLLLLVSVVTAKLTGGIGLSTFGSDVNGGKKYIYLWGAIAGYFAIVSQPIPPGRVLLYAGLYFLGPMTSAIGELAMIVSPAFYFVFLVFPVTNSGLRMIATGTTEAISRLEGFSPTGSAVFFWMLCRHGIKETLNFQRLGRLSLFLGFTALALLSGFRGTLIMFMLVFAVLFYLEGLMRSRMMPAFLLAAVTSCALLFTLSDRLPLSIQRTFSFLPMRIDPMVKLAAESSSEWRLEMWRRVLPEVPQHLVLGKGYSFTVQEQQLTTLGGDNATEGSQLVGDYHNGPLSVILPFGLPGVFAFLWFLASGFRVLQRNYLFGDAQYQNINRFIFAFFIARIVFFFSVFGGLSGDLPIFAGLVGLSVSLNRGVARPKEIERPKIVFNRFKLHPSARPAPALR